MRVRLFGCFKRRHVVVIAVIFIVFHCLYKQGSSQGVHSALPDCTCSLQCGCIDYGLPYTCMMRARKAMVPYKWSYHLEVKSARTLVTFSGCQQQVIV